jgi:YbbR domain-containing protein
MRRFVAFVVRNWPLKLAAIGLATFLYAGLVLSQSAQIWPGSIPIVPRQTPTSAVVVGNLRPVTNIRYFAPADIAAGLTRDSFTATVDLTDVVVQPGNPFVTVKVDVRANDERVTILGYDPPSITVQLDPLVTKTVPIQVDYGSIPTGLQIRDPVLSATEAVVKGPDSVVRLVTAAQARVFIQPSGIDVQQTVDLVAVDARGELVSPVVVEPSRVDVSIAVGSGVRSKSLPVDPVVTGTPAPGFEIDSVTVSPPVVSVEGDANALSSLTRIDTLPVSITGASADLSRIVGLDLPSGVDPGGTPKVTVKIALRPIAATRTYSAGVVLSGAKDDRTYSLSTASVTVTLGGTVAALDGIDPGTFAVVADVDGLGPGVHRVKLRVSLPADVKLVAMSPSEVTVTVAQSATPTPPPSATPVPSGP